MNNLYEGLKKHIDQEKVSFHMPGHKQKKSSFDPSFLDHLLSYDVTELSDTDDLYNATDLIRNFLEKMKQYAHSKASFLLTNGSTGGIIASILALTKHGDSILFERNSHKSIFNACEINRLEKVLLENEDPILPCSPTDYIQAVEKNPKIRMIVITRPNYYGYCVDLKKISDYCHRKGIYLIVDEAHGAHFPLKYFPKTAMECGAHVSINSLHKTLPAFTQTAMIHFRNETLAKKVTRMIEMLQTSSPSYLLMISAENAIDYALNNEEDYKVLLSNIDAFKKGVANISAFKIPKDSDLFEHDETRILIECENPSDVESYLRDHGVYIEMITDRCIVLLATPFNQKEDFDMTLHLLTSYTQTKTHKKELSYDYSKYIGMICLENVYVYPPGNVIIEKDTVITKEQVDKIMHFLQKGVFIKTDYSKEPGVLNVKINGA